VVQGTVAEPGLIGLSWWLSVNQSPAEANLVCVCICLPKGAVGRKLTGDSHKPVTFNSIQFICIAHFHKLQISLGVLYNLYT